MLEVVWAYWQGFSILIGMFSLTVLMPLSYFVLTRPFDKLVPRGMGPEYDLWFVSVLFVRPIMFAMQIVLPNADKRNPIAQLNWGGFDFRGHASRFQIIFSYVYITCLSYTTVFAIVLYVYDHFINYNEV